MFRNRQEAGRLLANLVVKRLAGYPHLRETPTIVVGLPRGGVPVAREVAISLHAPLTILVSKKIGAPFQPEFALGAVTSRGTVVLDQNVDRTDGELQEYVHQQAGRLTRSTKELETGWLQAVGMQPVNFKGRCVIVVDDGVATGMTTLAALKAISAEQPAALILAVPVIAGQTCYRLQNDCDLIVALQAPSDLQAVGLYYEDFHQVEDQEMLNSLLEANQNVSMDRAG